jgi:hypothetical protein
VSAVLTTPSLFYWLRIRFSPTECCKVFCRVQPQFADPRTDAAIGLYGNLFCMSAMRIGADALLFSKAEKTVCVYLYAFCSSRFGLCASCVLGCYCPL